jgi:hypothetical protein
MLADPSLETSVDESQPQTAKQSSGRPATRIDRSSRARGAKVRVLRPKRLVPSNAQTMATIETQEASVSLADLAALEEESVRLKTLLRDKLLAENARLNEMLRRFS